MPSIKELRHETQQTKVEGRERPWLYKSLQRGPSIYITKLLINTSLTPNTISLLMILFGVCGAYLLFLPGIYIKLLGLLFFYINILLDKVDGEIARYKKIFSLRGVYLDEINHLTIPGLFFASLTLSFFDKTPLPETAFLIFGMLAAMSMPFLRVGHSLAPQMYAKKYLKNIDTFPLPKANKQTVVDAAKQKYGPLYKVFYVVHQLQDFFIIILLCFIALLLSEFIYDTSILSYFIIAYGLLLPLIFIENTIKGFLQIEQRISNLHERFKKDQ